MKCPKCGYLGFETSDRCRNCGYEFSLTEAKSDVFDLALDPGPDESRPPLDLDRIIGAPEPPQSDDLPLFGDDAPLVSAGARPRAPLSVRRTTPEVPRARPRPTKTPSTAEMLFETPPAAIGRALAASGAGDTINGTLAAPVSRILAGLLDVALLSALDASILYFTLRLLGLTTSQMFELPLLPLVAFFVLLNGGYFVTFTAVGGQSIGKMAFGIKVISQEEDAVPIARATVRTLAYIVSALPLGAGFIPGVLGERLALHDRLAHTRVVRPSST
ncbi:MAG TPA: RDD family protein [Vicinamibacterales bacterium]|nr:RDD family protein [Vicinamibacterales bacterium]